MTHDASTSSSPCYQVVVVGGSTGGVTAIKRLLESLPAGFGLPLAIVLHVQQDQEGSFSPLFRCPGGIEVNEAEECAALRAGQAYFAPPGYHLLIESGGTFSLSTDAPVCYARPSIDVLFESAADAYRDGVIAVVLTGANVDGSRGAAIVKQKGGTVIVQDPDEAEMASMPRAAIEAAQVDHVLSLAEIGALLRRLGASDASKQG
jgi:two-component system chemotaxis response regulator CheB